jgi:hypothetical protein
LVCRAIYAAFPVAAGKLHMHMQLPSPASPKRAVTAVFALRPIVSVLLASACLGIACSTAAALLVAGLLGQLLGMVVLAALVSPAVVLMHANQVGRLLSVAAYSLAMCACGCMLMEGLSPLQWLRVILIISLWALAVSGLACVVSACRAPRLFAYGLAAFLSLVWLAWPFWMAPQLRGVSAESIVGHLVPLHPAFVLNGQIGQFDSTGHWQTAFPIAWTQHRLAYRFTNLGDDVPYHLPTSMLPYLAMQVTLAFGLILSWSSPPINRQGAAAVENLTLDC